MFLSMGLDGRFKVALRKESVDRNKKLKTEKRKLKTSLSARRAWIEILITLLEMLNFTSLSARRAWIEIPAGCWRDARRAVALRKESVDRNQGVHYDNYNLHCVALRKESVDRNLWWGVRKAVGSLVALRKESVDRNCDLEPIRSAEAGRSPQGERG